MMPLAPPPPKKVTLGDFEKKVATQLLKMHTTHYRGIISPTAGLRYSVLDYNQPLFNRFWIPAMERDPHLWYGFQMLRGPIISKAKYKVNSDNPDVLAFVDRQIKRFWTNGIPLSLTAMEYGFCGAEVVYRYNKQLGTMEYGSLKYLHPRDVRPVLKNSALVGIRVKRIATKAGNETYKYIPHFYDIRI